MARTPRCGSPQSSRSFGAQCGRRFKVRLTPVPIEASTAAKTKGSGSATASLDGTTLTVNGSFAGLQGPATVAHLHEGAATGVRGAAIADFTVPQSRERLVQREFTLTAAQIREPCARAGSTCRSTAPPRPTATSGVGCLPLIPSLSGRRADRARSFHVGVASLTFAALAALCARARPLAQSGPLHRAAGGRGPLVVSRELRGLPSAGSARHERGAAARRRGLHADLGADARRRSSSRSWRRDAAAARGSGQPRRPDVRQPRGVPAAGERRDAGHAPRSPRARSIAIGSVANGRCRTACGGARDRGARGRGRRRLRGRTGLTLQGHIEGFTPVTDAQLLATASADWLMIRGDYRAWNYSELNQITRDNVDGLQLQWIWSMTDGGWNEPAPIVHGGVLYSYNQGNVIQALDAATRRAALGEPASARAPTGSAMRGIAIYDDKVYHRRRTTRGSSRSTRAPARRSGRRSSATARKATSGVERPDRHQGQGRPGHRQLHALPQGEVLHQRVRREGRARALAVQHGRVPARARRATRGATCRTTTARAATPGSPAATIPTSTPRTGASRRRSRGWPRAAATRRSTARSTRARRSRSTRAPAQLKWYFQHAPGESLDLDEVYERVLVDVGGEQGAVHDRQARHPLEARSRDRRVPRLITRRCSRTSSTRSIPRPVEPHYRADIVATKKGDWVAGVPEHRGRPQLAGDELQPADAAADHPAVAELHRDARRSRSSRSRAAAARARIGASTRCLERTATSASSRPTTPRRCKSSGRSSSARRSSPPCCRRAAALAFVGDLDREFKAVDVATGKILWRDAARDVGAGIPDHVQRRRPSIPRGVDRRRRRKPAPVVPSLIAPEIHHPATGNAIYVFALPEKNRAGRRLRGRSRILQHRRARSSVDRVLASEAKGRGFESRRARQFFSSTAPTTTRGNQ